MFLFLKHPEIIVDKRGQVVGPIYGVELPKIRLVRQDPPNASLSDASLGVAQLRIALEE